MLNKEIRLMPGEHFADKSQEEINIFCITGSNVAVIFIDMTTHTVVVGNVLLPDSTINRRQQSANPVMYADTAIPFLINTMLEKRSLGEGRDFNVVLVGGSDIKASTLLPDLGAQNLAAINDQFNKYNLIPHSAVIGGSANRHVAVDAQKMGIRITSSGLEDVEL